jgi:hypothetical protein
MILLGILIFKGLTAWRLYKSFGVKGLISLVKTTNNVSEWVRITVSLSHVEEKYSFQKRALRHELITCIVQIWIGSGVIHWAEVIFLNILVVLL